MSSARTAFCVLRSGPPRPNAVAVDGPRPARGLGFADYPQRGGIPGLPEFNGVGMQRLCGPGRAEHHAGHVQRAAGCSARGLVTVGKSAATAFGLTFIPAAANTAAEPPKPCPIRPSLSGCTPILPGPRRTPAAISSALPRSKARLSTDGAIPRSVSGAAYHDPPRGQVLQQSGITLDAGDPVVAEGHCRQVQARLGRVDHARHACEGQVAS